MWQSIPKNDNASMSFDPDQLAKLIDDSDRERSTLAKLSTNTMTENRDSMGLDEKAKEYLARFPVLNNATVARIASKYAEQSGRAINAAPLKKKRRPSP